MASVWIDEDKPNEGRTVTIKKQQLGRRKSNIKQVYDKVSEDKKIDKSSI